MSEIRLRRSEFAILLYYAVSPFMYLLKPYEIEWPVMDFVLRAQEPLLVLYFLIQNLKRPLRIDWFGLVLLGFVGYGAVSGMLNANNSRDILGGVTHQMVAISLYLYYFNWPPADEKARVHFLKIFSWTVLGVFILVMPVLHKYESIFGRPLYLGLSAPELLVPFFTAGVVDSFLVMGITMTLILLTGKRGVAVAAGVGSLILFARVWRRWWKVGAGAAVLAVLLGGTLVSFLPQRIVSKFANYDSVGAANYSSERLDELVSAADDWFSDHRHVALGKGAGAAYTFRSLAGITPPQPGYRNVHFSPANLFIMGGVFFGSMMLLVLAWTCVQVWGPLTGSLGVFRLTFYSCLVYSFFVFNLFNEPLLWMSLGLLRAESKRDGFRGK